MSLHKGRNAVEAEFGRLKLYYALRRPRVRGLDRMSLYVDLVMLARLSVALARLRSSQAIAL
jgi:hypothetical protein